VDVYTLIFLIGAAGGAALVGLAWIAWWRWESRRPIHCQGCTCAASTDGRLN